MVNKSEMEIKYEQYLESDDTVLTMGNKQFFKIVSKDKLSIKNGLVLICVPWSAFGKSCNCIAEDENGNVFELAGPAHFSFRTSVPRWYLDTCTLEVKNIHDIDEIGWYISVAQNINNEGM